MQSLEANAAQLLCQATALQAKAAGAEGLLSAEQARAQAADVEAEALKVRACLALLCYTQWA